MKTRFSVRLADVVSRVLITVGGIGTIAAVLLVFLFLGAVVIPLFAPAYVEPWISYDSRWGNERPLHVEIDEYRSLGWVLFPDGRLQIYRVVTGEIIGEQQITDGLPITAASFSIGDPDTILGFDDGSIRVGRIAFVSNFLEKKDMPAELHDLEKGGEAVYQGGIVQRTPIGQFRLQQVVAEFRPPVKIADTGIVLLDHQPPTDRERQMGAIRLRTFALSAAGELKYAELSERRVGFGRMARVEVQASTKDLDVPLQTHAQGLPVQLLVTAGASDLILVWEDGTARRIDVRNPAEPAVVEELDLLSDPAARITACDLLIGRESVLVADSKGGLRTWFMVRTDASNDAPPAAAEMAEEALAGVAAPLPGPEEEPPAQPPAATAFRLTMVHELPQRDSPVRSLGISQRSRMIVAGYESGEVAVYHVYTAHEVVATAVESRRPAEFVAIAPKDDGLFAWTDERTYGWNFDPRHPEATFASLLMPIWYEGYGRPQWTWQSSFAGVGPEMKLSLVPLVFGTIKATLYSMLFGAPLALLAAIYTSEFLHPKVRAKVKPTIEVMASLPSVVLGFLAALVFAPIAERIVPAILVCFFTIPFCLLLGAYLWQLLPRSVELIFNRFGLRLAAIFVVLGVGLGLALMAGPLVEGWLFAGNIKRWLNDHSIGNGVGGWLLTLVPLSALAAALVMTTIVNPLFRDSVVDLPRPLFGLVNLGKFLAGAAIAFLLAYGCAWLLVLAGFDPRGGYIDTFVQRNALVVGFVMGFAIIPIIYTIAEDALTTVPTHLRSASLGAGATPWQTAVRIVIPTAMSGLFSALMIGLGRAVGETMIVLMAAGNTPVMEWNIFNGFRTLSANIAVELPEAVRDSTHYRTLFLAAFTLFLMTFVVNTIAEVIRLRFRRRAYQL